MKKRNKNLGQILYKRAKKIIPGGTMLLSKRPEMFLPDNWPSYFSKAKDINVWDLEGNKLIDMSIMGVGTNSLGYANKFVDLAVKKAISKGNLSTLNCREEVDLAEKLIEINPWAQMVRFARTGGEANSIAIRIARAASAKDGVAICGYHGWHDWYLASNLKNKNNLNTHLLSGLDVNGVPKSLIDTVFQFKYNDIEGLKRIIQNNKIGVIKMEVFRNIEPENNFLHKVRELANKNNIVLIFDECTSGFRETYGGLYNKYNVIPDIVIFGKTLGNGYAITAVIGKYEVMNAAQSTFISSTFWTERIGPSAALETLKIMKKENSWQKITDLGIFMKNKISELAKTNSLKLNFFGLPSISSFSFESSDHLKYKTYITQELLKLNYLASTQFYASTKHSEKQISKFINKLEPVFKNIAKFENKDLDVDDFLDSPTCHSGFERLN